MKKKYKTGIFILIAVIIGIFNPITLICWFLWNEANPETGINEKTVSWLPKEATNVSYYRSYSFTAFEFDISEDAFKKWAKEWDIKRIKNPIDVTRYTLTTTGNPSIGYDSNAKNSHKDQCRTRARITNGYYYRTIPRSDGGSTHVAYDLDIGRAYFQANPR